MKLLFKVLLSALVLLLLGSVAGYFYMRKKFIPAPNQLVVSGLPATTNFTWLADTADGRAMPHAAVLLPVRVPGCSRTCYLQFDTGAPYSLLKSTALDASETIRRHPAAGRQHRAVHHWHAGHGRARGPGPGARLPGPPF